MIRGNILLALALMVFSWAGGCVSVGPAAGPGDALSRLEKYDFEVSEATLPNGLKVLLVPRPQSNMVSCRFLVKTGSMYEGEMLGSGLTHLLEHLVMGGSTQTQSEKAYTQLRDYMGGVANASTSKTHTMFYVDTAPPLTPMALKALGEWVFTSNFTEREWQREKKVVLEELRRGLDEPERRVYQLMEETVFLDSPARVPVIGYPAAVSAVTPEQLKNYYRGAYVPSNMVLAVVGNFEPEKALEFISNLYGVVPQRAFAAPVLTAEPSPGAPRLSELEMPIQEGWAALAWRTVPIWSEDMYPLDVASAVLGMGRSARLVAALRDPGLVRSISSFSLTPDYDGGMFAVIAAFDYPKLPKVVGEIEKQIHTLATERVGAEELAKVKNIILADYIRDHETVGGIAQQVLSDYASTGDAKFTVKYLRRILKVTPDEVQNAVKRYLDPSRRVTAVVRPKGAAPAQELLSPRTAAASRPSAAPETQKFVLPNGIKLLVREDHSFPMVAVQTYALGGVRLETPENNGIFNLMMLAITRGTRSRDAGQIARLTDQLGLTLESGSGNCAMFLNMQTLSHNLDAAFDLYADILTKPAFPAEEVNRLKTIVAQQIRAQDDDPFGFAEKRLREALYSRSPYRMEPIGNAGSVARLKSEDLANLYSRYMVPNNMVIAVFGDVKADEAQRLAARHFGALKPQKELLVSAVPVEGKLETTQRLNVTGPFGTAVVMMGFPGIGVADTKNQPILSVLTTVLAGAGYPSGTLHEALRGEEKGLVYVVAAGSRPFIEPGFVWIFAQTNPANVDEVLGIINSKLEEVRKNAVSDKSLKLARQELLVHEMDRTQQLARQASEAALDELYGIGYSWPKRFLEAIGTVDSEQVKAMAQNVFGHGVTIVVAPAQKPATRTAQK